MKTITRVYYLMSISFWDSSLDIATVAINSNYLVINH